MPHFDGRTSLAAFPTDIWMRASTRSTFQRQIEERSRRPAPDPRAAGRAAGLEVKPSMPAVRPRALTAKLLDNRAGHDRGNRWNRASAARRSKHEGCRDSEAAQRRATSSAQVAVRREVHVDGGINREKKPRSSRAGSASTSGRRLGGCCWTRGPTTCSRDPAHPAHSDEANQFTLNDGVPPDPA